MARRRAERFRRRATTRRPSATGSSVGIGRRRVVRSARLGGRGAGRPRAVAAAQRPSGGRRRAPVPLAQPTRSSSRACGTGPGSSPAGWTTRCASSATSFRPPARSIRWRRTGPDCYRYALTGEPHGDASAAAERCACFGCRSRRGAPGPALIAGQLWIDSATAEVVRLTFRYVGTALWVRPEEGPRGPDSAKARRLNALANRIVSIDADLEYGLQEGRYWMPHRQVLAGRVRLPMVSDVVIPFQATTTFDDYEINGGRPIAFDLPLPDTAGPEPATPCGRCAGLAHGLAPAERARSGRARRTACARGTMPTGGPAAATSCTGPSERDAGPLRRAGPIRSRMDTDPADPRRLRDAEAELARLAETLPDSITGQASRGFGFERLSDLFRYDRVQGLSFGLGYRVRAPRRPVRQPVRDGALRPERRPGDRAPQLRAGRAGRPPDGERVPRRRRGRSVLAWDGRSATPSTRCSSPTTTRTTRWPKAGRRRSRPRSRPGLDLSVGARVERRGTRRAGRPSPAVNDFLGGDGVFPPNPPVDEGTFGGGSVAAGARGRPPLEPDGRRARRGAGEPPAGSSAICGRTSATGAARPSGSRPASRPRPTLAQTAFRLGGLGTVRGFEYGTRDRARRSGPRSST